MPQTLADVSRMPVLASATFHVTAADTVAAQRAHLRWRFILPRTFIVAAIVGAALYGLDTWLNPRSYQAAHIISALAAMAIYLLIVPLTYALVPLSARRAFRRQPNLHHLWRVDLSEGGLRAVTPNQDSFVAWADYVAWHDGRRVILLYQGELLFQFIPVSAAGPEFIATLQRLAAHLPRR